jgi:hypothetical protein
MRSFNKVFGIGLTKTGTSSLSDALTHVGLRTMHWPKCHQDFFDYQALTDITVSSRFKELDQMFPGSLFIYTERMTEEWLPSVLRHYETAGRAVARLIDSRRMFVQEAEIRLYGTTRPSGVDFTTAYHAHHENVLNYFRSRPDALLRLDITSGDGWEPLCRFLRLPVRETPFPHRHKSAADGKLPATRLG